MPTITKTESGNWKAMIRKTGWPPNIKTFRLKKDADDRAHRTEDEMVRGVHIQRTASERTTVTHALDRYLTEVSPTKKASTQKGELAKAKALRAKLGKYALGALTPDLVAGHRDARLAQGKSNNTVRLELALLGHLYTVAIKEWRIGLAYNPVQSIRKPAPGEGRNRRLANDEEKRLLKECDAHSNPMFGWIVRIALETGMRSSEIVSMRRSQVDLTRRIAWLSDTKNNTARTVPLSQAATTTFHKAINHPIRPIDTDLIFFGEPGRS